MTGKNTLPKYANIIPEQMWGFINLDFNWILNWPIANFVSFIVYGNFVFGNINKIWWVR